MALLGAEALRTGQLCATEHRVYVHSDELLKTSHIATRCEACIQKALASIVQLLRLLLANFRKLWEAQAAGWRCHGRVLLAYVSEAWTSTS